MNSITEVDRKKIKVMVCMGKSTPDIQSAFDNRYTRQQIAAIRAWVTMDSEVPRESKHTDLLEGDKQRIAGYVKDGMSTEAIINKFKGKFSRQQIAAIRAWVTMGKY